VVNDYDYDVFGALRDSSGSQANDFTFAGEQGDASADLQYLRARYYDPIVGRLLSQDLFPANPMEPATYNRFAYVLNDPVNLVDPSGEHCKLWHPHHCGWENIVQYLDVIPLAEICEARFGEAAGQACDKVETAIGVASAYAAIKQVSESDCNSTYKAALIVLITQNLNEDLGKKKRFGEIRELLLLQAQNGLLKTCPHYEFTPDHDIGPG
jgi:RHS repeat-associated protein